MFPFQSTRLSAILFGTFASITLLQAQPNINATKTDVFTPNGAGKVIPGAPIKYQTVIGNTGSTNATGVNLADAVPAGTTLVANSVNVSPLAFDDTYSTIVNTQLAAGTPTVLSGPVVTSITKTTGNDQEFLSDSFTISVYNTTSAQGGSVVMVTSGANMGSFTYLPAAGFVGTDTFTYTIRDDGTDSTAGNADDLTGSGTVTITVTEANTSLAGTQKVWYIDNSYAGANGTENGTSARPFNALSDVTGNTGPDATTDTLFVSTGSGPYTGGVTLLADQSLIGENQALILNSITLRNAGTDPVITNSGGNGVTLATRNTLQGFTIGDTTSGDIVGTSFVTLAVSNLICNGTGPIMTLNNGAITVSLDTATTTSSTTTGISLTDCSGFFTGTSGAISGVTGNDFVVSGGTANVSYAGTITNNSNRSILVTSKTGGTVGFSNLITDSSGSTGISLTSNTSTTINFTGGITASTGGNACFNATSAGTVNVTGNNNTLTTTTATALNVANTTIGASGLIFRSISANGAANGIILNTTGSTGGLTVSGDGGGSNNASGGTIQNCTASGVMLTSTSNVSLNYMTITTSGDDGISGNSVTGFTMNRCNVTNNGNTVNTDDGVDFGGSGLGTPNPGLFGTSNITNSVFTGNYNNQFTIRNSSGTAAMTMTSCTVNGRVAENNNNDGLFLDSLGTATITANIQSSSFSANKGDHFQAAATSSGNLNVTFKSNTLTGGHSSALGQGITINAALGVPGYTGTVRYDINGNNINGAISVAISVVQGTSASSAIFNGFIQNNIIGTSGAALSGSAQTHGIVCEARGNGTHTSAITGNTIRRCADRGIGIAAGDGSAVFNLNITGNTVTELSDTNNINGTAREAIEFNLGITSTNVFGGIDAPIVRVNLSSNSLIGGAYKNGDIRMRKRQRARVELPGYTGAFNDTAAVITYHQGNNSGSTATCAVTDDLGVSTDGYFATTGSVAEPAVTPLPLLFAANLPETNDGIETTDIQATPTTTAQQPILSANHAQEAATPAIPLTPENLQILVAEAKARWIASGLTTEQKTALASVQIQLSDLSVLHLGQANSSLIEINRTAAGNAWFIDPTPADDSEFARETSSTRRMASTGQAAMDQVDLLTTLMHEMGHTIGLGDRYDPGDRNSIMFGYLTRGERRMPVSSEARYATPHRDDTTRFLGTPITIGTLPPGKSVTIVGTVTVNDPASSFLISSQGTVSGGGFADVLTDDTSVGGAANPTETPVERPDTSVTTLNRNYTSPSNTSSVAWNIVLAHAVSGLTSANFSLANSGLGGAPAISSVTAVGGAPASTWTITASTGTGSGTLGLNMANDTSLNYDVTNLTFTGQVYTIDRTPPNASIGLSDAALKIGDTSTVTITFTKAVGGLTFDDFTVDNGSVSAPGTLDGGITWTATLTPNASVTDSTNIITLDKTAVTDTLGNAGVGSSASPNYTVDTIRPTTSSIVVADTNLMIGETSTVTFTFSEAVTDFSTADLSVDNGAVSGLATGDGGITWTATLTPTTGVTDNSNVITLDNTGVTDLAGNAGTGTTDSNNYEMVGMTIAIAADAASTSEGSGGGNTAFNFTVSRLGSTTSSVTMDYAVSGAAVNVTDFGGTLPTGTVTIPATQSSVTLAINVVRDNTVELNEAFTVTLSNPGDGVIATPSASTTILNDDSSVVSLAGGSANEGDSGTSDLQFTVSLTNPVDVDVSVSRQSTLTGTATVVTDFTALAAATLTIPAGNTSATFDVTMIGDNDVEPDETIGASISTLSASSRSVTLGTSTASGTITNDDPLLVAANTSMSVKKGISGKLKVAELLALTTPVESRPISLVSVQNPSAAGGTVTVLEGWIYYQPLAGYTGLDSFTYTITDGVQTVNGTVSVTITTVTGTTPNVYKLTDEGADKRLQSLGIPGRRYQMETSEDMTTWTPRGAALVCPPAGVMSFLDPGPLPPTRFYRVVETNL